MASYTTYNKFINIRRSGNRRRQDRHNVVHCGEEEGGITYTTLRNTFIRRNARESWRLADIKYSMGKKTLYENISVASESKTTNASGI